MPLAIDEANTLLVEPSTHHVDAVLRAGVPSGTSVTTLPLLEARLARALLPSLRVASPALSRVALRMVLRRSEGVRALADLSGLAADDLVDAMSTALGTLRSADVDARVLNAAIAREGPALRRRAAVLAEALGGHDAALAAFGLVDGRSLASRLAAAIEAASPAAISSALSGATVVEIRDVTGLSPARLAWIEALHAALLRAGGRVLVVTPTAHDALLVTCGIEDPRERIASRLEERFATAHVAPDLVHRPPGSGDGPLARVAARLFAARAFGDEPPVDVGDALDLVAAAGVDVAAQVAAVEAARALRRGVAPERVVIALPTLDEEIVRPLRRALATLGVPCWEARGAPPASSQPVASLLAALRALDEGARKDLVVDLLLGAAELTCERDDSGGPTPPEPERVGRRARVRAAAALRAIAGSSLPREGDAILAALEPDARAIAEPIVRMLRVEETPTLSRALEHVHAMAGALGWPSALSRGAADIVRRGDGALLEALAADLAAWSSIADAVTDLSRAAALAGASDEPIGWTELARELESALESRGVVAASRTAAVPIARLRDRLGLDCDVLIVLETHDGALPARGSSDPLLSRPLLRALAMHDARRAPPPQALVGALDLLAAIDAIGRARERVVVLHRSVDDDRRRQSPGALPVELARVSTARPRAERAFAIPTGGVARRPLDVALHRAFVARGGARDALDRDVVARADAEVARARAFARAEEGRALRDRGSAAGGTRLDDRFTGLLEPLGDERRALLHDRLGGSPRSALSVSAAEELLACPFLVFAGRVLRARPDSPAPDDGGPRDAGDLAHAALLEVHRALRDAAVSPYDEAAVARFSADAIDRVLSSRATTTVLQRLRRERLREDLLALVHADVAQMRDEGRRFFEGEVPFGDGQPWPALDARGVFVTGRIDRVDFDAERGVATVVDYKARAPVGATTAAFFDERRPGSAQIALYAHVVAQNFQPLPSKVVARFVGYRDRKPGALVGTSKSGDDAAWRTNVGVAAGGGDDPGAVLVALGEAATAARDGLVPARRGRRCAQCDQRAACRVPRVVLDAPDGDDS